CGGLDAHQHMKVILEQAISVGVGDRRDVAGVQPEEMAVVTLLKEQVLAVVAAVVDVIVAAGLERNRFGHVGSPTRDGCCSQYTRSVFPKSLDARDLIAEAVESDEIRG